jgi:hypothetical protein
MADNKDTNSDVEILVPASGSIFPQAALPVAALAFALALASLVMILNQPRAPALGFVDLGGIMAVKEQQFTAMLTKANITEADRAAAFDMVKLVGTQVEGSLKAVRDECKCILLVKGAVVSVDHPSLTDYTPLLKAKLGMDK